MSSMNDDQADLVVRWFLELGIQGQAFIFESAPSQ
jgi:hypothetical protein